LTPYGYPYLSQLFQEILPTRENLINMGSVAAYISPFSYAELDPFGLVKLANISIVTLLCLFLRNFRKVEWSSLIANMVFVYLYTRLYRTTFYWAPVFLFSSLTLLANRPLIPVNWKHWYSTLLLPILTLLLACWLSSSVIRQAVLWPEMSLWAGFGIGDQNPVAEAKYIKKYFPIKRIGNTYDEGAYLLWELWPQNTVFIDARHFPFQEMNDAYWNVFHSDLASKKPAEVEEFLLKYPCDVWCVGYNSWAMSRWFFTSPDWQLAFYGKSAAVFVRKEIPLPEIGSAKFSPDLDTLKNLGNVREVLLWTVMIRDWQAADVVLARSHEYFTAPQQQVIVRKMERYVQNEKKRLTNE
jgi:hypothetical protein